jgi:hypothetical protein
MVSRACPAGQFCSVASFRANSGGPVQGWGIYRAGISPSFYFYGAHAGSWLTLPAVTVLDDLTRHIAIVADASELRMYVDGALDTVIARNETAYQQPIDPYEFVIGGSLGTGTQSFLGTLDEVALYDRVLSAAEIATHSSRVVTSQRSCAEILAARPGSPSGVYVIDPDGAGAEPSLSVYCDMTTMGGGWTLVFAPNNTNYASLNVDYTVPSPSLRGGATEAMIAFRNTSMLASAINPVRFLIPMRWRMASPMADIGTAETVSWTSPTMSGTATLYYGYQNWNGSTCSNPFSGTLNAFGRVCLEGVAEAPFYSAFAWGGADAGDYCSLSGQSYGMTPCSATRAFTIAVR